MPGKILESVNEQLTRLPSRRFIRGLPGFFSGNFPDGKKYSEVYNQIEKHITELQKNIEVLNKPTSENQASYNVIEAKKIAIIIAKGIEEVKEFLDDLYDIRLQVFNVEELLTTLDLKLIEIHSDVSNYYEFIEKGEVIQGEDPAVTRVRDTVIQELKMVVMKSARMLKEAPFGSIEHYFTIDPLLYEFNRLATCNPYAARLELPTVKAYLNKVGMLSTSSDGKEIAAKKLTERLKKKVDQLDVKRRIDKEPHFSALKRGIKFTMSIKPHDQETTQMYTDAALLLSNLVLLKAGNVALETYIQRAAKASKGIHNLIDKIEDQDGEYSKELCDQMEQQLNKVYSVRGWAEMCLMSTDRTKAFKKLLSQLQLSGLAEEIIQKGGLREQRFRPLLPD
ncbi:MAG: hypothetical protein ACXAEU_08490 [Candidatus Hodarchaeales archaeon]